MNDKNFKIGFSDIGGIFIGKDINWGILWQKFILLNLPVEFPNIKIWKHNYTNEIFETTIHELAHASHISLLKSLVQYAQVPVYIYESWASAIEWYISKIEYSELLATGYIENNKQTWPVFEPLDYSSLFIDLVDN